MKNNNIIVYSQKIAGVLMQRGYRLLGVDRNHKDYRKFIFRFAYDENIFNIIEECKQKNK